MKKFLWIILAVIAIAFLLDQCERASHAQDQYERNTRDAWFHKMKGNK